ncbi:MAG TPA: hypothetical protein VFB89_12955 [Gemmatimonadales bacterium]|nr:hypothetical protein [Gemmatimonadales bacterium]
MPIQRPLNDDSVAARAPTRQITVLAQDPSVRRDSKIVMARIDVPAEDLAAGR